MKILATGIHADDCEYGLGGTAALLCERGHEVLFVNPNPCGQVAEASEEANAQNIRAAEILGAKKDMSITYQTKYYQNNEESTRQLEKIIRDFKPDIVFNMHPRDNHIEHVEFARTTRDALFAAAVDGIAPNEVYTYECGPNQSMLYFIPDLMIDVTSVEETLTKSIKAFAQKHAQGEWLWHEKKVCANFRHHTCTYSSSDGLGEGFKILKFPERNNGFLLLDALKDFFYWNVNKMYYPRSNEIF